MRGNGTNILPLEMELDGMGRIFRSRMGWDGTEFLSHGMGWNGMGRIFCPMGWDGMGRKKLTHGQPSQAGLLSIMFLDSMYVLLESPSELTTTKRSKS